MFAAAFAIGGITTTMAEIPSRALLGVQRVVISCDADPTLNAADTRAICEQLVKKAQSVTRLPVFAATDKKLQPLGRGDGDQLVLQIALSATGMKSDRGSLSLTVTPSRGQAGLDKGAPLASQAQLARIEDKLVVQGPVDAFTKILGGAPAELKRPIKSDS
jgi:hypothetical protein